MKFADSQISPPTSAAARSARREVDAALGLVASRPSGLARTSLRRPRPAWCRASSRSTDSRTGDQRVGRQVVLGHIGVELGLGPVGQRVELDLAVGRPRRPAATARPPPWKRLRPVIQASKSASGHGPAAATLRRAQQASVSVCHSSDSRIDHGQVAERAGAGRARRSGPACAARLRAIVEGLAEQHAGVEEQHRRSSGLIFDDQVQQHRRLRPEGRDQRQLVAEAARRPARRISCGGLRVAFSSPRRARAPASDGRSSLHIESHMLTARSGEDRGAGASGGASDRRGDNGRRRAAHCFRGRTVRRHEGVDAARGP